MAFYNEDINEIFKKLNSCANGISQASANERRKTFGSNELEKQKRNGFLKKFAAQFKNIMIIILLISAGISLATAIFHKDSESLFESILILTIVFVNAAVGVLQEQKAENSLAALESMAQPFAKVLRDGVLQKIKFQELVVGDIVLLKTGDNVPADIRLFECKNLECNESSMTGESHPVAKTEKKLSSKNLTLSEQANICFSGTNITNGSAKGIVVRAGKQTELGKIAKILNSQTKQKTPLEKNIDKIGKVLTIGILLVVAIVFLIQVLFNKSITAMDALLTAVALAVAAIPESLPAIITIIMALGVQKLAKQNAIVKKLSAVETLGSCNIICSDKTGTLTKNQMTVKSVFAANKVQEKNFDLKSHKSLTLAASLCNNLVQNKSGEFVSDATEIAIGKFLRENEIDVFAAKKQSSEIAENEFSSTKKMMEKLVKTNGSTSLLSKGALDYVLPLCDTIVEDGKIVPLSAKTKQKILLANESVCSKGERVIAFAMKENAKSINEKSLTFLGFFGIIDPPKEETSKSVKLCKKAGLKTIMITGDHPATAFAIAKQIGIAKHKNEVLTGDKISKLSAKSLAKIISAYSVFARVTPEHKLKIVEALKQNGNIVSMTGDGINDTPSIKSANIGVAMGITGTDVTKEVADIIISDDNFSTIVVAVKEGRTIYENISKTIIFLLSTNIVEVLGIFVTSLVMPSAVFLLPIQILFINLVTDSLPAFALGIEPAEPNIMQKPPRDANKSLLSGKAGWTILYQGFIQSLVVLVMFVFASHTCGSEVASTMSFLTICFMQLIHSINCKTEQSIFKINIFKNKFFNLSFVALFVLILLVYFIPFSREIFGLTLLSLWQWLAVLVTSLAIVPAVEIGKFVLNTKKEIQN